MERMIKEAAQFADEGKKVKERVHAQTLEPDVHAHLWQLLCKGVGNVLAGRIRTSSGQFI